MSGYSRFYVFGGQGGYLGADGVNPIALMILIGDGNRQSRAPPPAAAEPRRRRWAACARSVHPCTGRRTPDHDRVDARVALIEG